jgi:hypothetical protein
VCSDAEADVNGIGEGDGDRADGLKWAAVFHGGDGEHVAVAFEFHGGRGQDRSADAVGIATLGFAVLQFDETISVDGDIDVG